MIKRWLYYCEDHPHVDLKPSWTKGNVWLCACPQCGHGLHIARRPKP